MTASKDPSYIKTRSVEEWKASRRDSPEDIAEAKKILLMIRDGADVFKTIRKNPLPNRGNISKYTLVQAYHQMVEAGELQEDPELLAKIRMKPSRTLSGVTTVTVLTAPWPCPGNCIFCPSDERMPKSYLPDEPGAARAFQNQFDPYLQVSSRIQSYEAVGHPTDKIELLILGGSWTSYPWEYQQQFIQRCFDAMNECESESLQQAQHINETASHRNVGLVVETRPDLLDAETLRKLRLLGVTKLQLGIQSMNDDILMLNRRSLTVKEALEHVSLARAAGFKIVLHWMPNLLGATPESDRDDFKHFWQSPEEGYGYCPDELKIYPTQLLQGTDLYSEWEKGNYEPYDMDTLVHLLADIKPTIQPYCRVNRVIRDIPSHHVVAGNTRSSLRMDIQELMKENGTKCRCIRCREIRGQKVQPGDLVLQDFRYHAAYADEHFLQFVTADDKLAGYLRLSIPDDPQNAPIEEIKDCALIREVHIYGQSLPVGAEQSGAAQHIGLGSQLIEEACRISKAFGFSRIAVIAAIGTRQYYESRGFLRGDYYLIRDLYAGMNEER
ncbi:MAG: tRNA uridine(34) 5-carboxymethylaminomethyl modification radical SAM/GNAT enzyme Elp3 [Anaerolineaceae bacterium]|nr:tRNA uridine(34) 5-carboxymethylaminomethyl modification radical SAM/GNAT enzyme Elp3 [Anaerolineaceae bacterium]